MRRYLTLLALLSMFALPAAAQGADVVSSSSESAPKVEEGAEDESFWASVNRWYPIYLDEALEPEVEEQVVPMWVTSVFCGQLCGPLWIPMVFVGEDPGMEYFLKEALIAILLELGTSVLGVATTPLVGLGAILFTANIFYFVPVSIINTYDRALKRQRAAGDPPTNARRSPLPSPPRVALGGEVMAY